MDNNAEAMVDKVTQWSNINSHSFNISGLEKLAVLLAKDFSVLECERNIFSLPAVEYIDTLGMSKSLSLGPMLRFWKRPAAPIQVLLVGHMDTVYEQGHSFQKVVRKTDRIIQGPGVTDMKGGLCVMLEALRIFEKSIHNNQLGWEVLINPDEEIGSLGSAPFLAERAKLHQVGLLFEPAMDEAGALAGDRKGSGTFTLIVYGRAAHAGRDFFKGRSAITELAQIISKIDTFNGKQEGVTFNVGYMQGGGSVNVVPDFAICRLDVRTLKVEQEQWVRDNLEAILTQTNQKDGFKAELKGKFNRKPKVLVGKTKALYDWVAEIGQEMGQTITWKPSGGCCDGNNLSEAGLPNVDTLGVFGGKTHSDEEYLLVDSLISRTKLVAAILSRLSQGKFKN